MKNIIIVTLAILALGAACQKKTVSVMNTDIALNTNIQIANSNQAVANTNANVPAHWNFNGQNWIVIGTPPDCASPVTMRLPVDLTLVSNILYPGQIRGGDYKPHGGFIFNGQPNNDINVTAPLDAVVVSGARYIEQGEIQYLFDFENRCGLRYRFDHLLTLTPAFEALASRLPAAQIDQSQTTNFSDPISVTAGDEIATAVGFKKNLNVSVDFGTYDLRARNTAAADATWAAAYANEASQAYYATCWFDYFSAGNAAQIRALPAGDGTAGKTSDYCH